MTYWIDIHWRCCFSMCSFWTKMAKSYFKQEHEFGIIICWCIWGVIKRNKKFNFNSEWKIDIVAWSNLAEKRRAEASRIREKYPDRIPVRITRSDPGCSLILVMNNLKNWSNYYCKKAWIYHWGISEWCAVKVPAG